MKTELETYLSESIYELNSFNEASIFDGLDKIDVLLRQLCIKANPNNASNYYNSKSGRDLTIRPTHAEEQGLNKSINELFSDKDKDKDNVKDTERTVFTATRKWKIPNRNDRVFGEFILLQDLVEYNLVNNLINLLNWSIRDQGHDVSDATDDSVKNQIICLNLKILQGCLLLHPNSRKLFHNEHSMSILVGLLHPKLNASMRTNIIICCIPTLVSSLVRNVANLRLFEQLNGPEIICNLLKGKNISINNRIDDEVEWQKVQVKVLEFLFFYLVPEFKSEGGQDQGRGESEDERDQKGQGDNKDQDQDQDQDKDRETQTELGTKMGADGVVRRNMENKVQILNRYLNRDVTSGLVQEMMVSKPFGNMNIEW